MTKLEKSNPKIKYLRKLIKKDSFRKQEKKFVVEGVRLVEELMKYPEKIEAIFYSSKTNDNKRAADILKKARLKHIPCWLVSNDLIISISDTCTSQGIIALAHAFEYELEDLLLKDKCILLLLNEIQDPGNLGTIIRAADAFKATGIILSKGTVDLYNPKTLRASMGSIFHLPIATSADILDTIKMLDEMGAMLLASSLRSDLCIDKVDLTQNICFIIGNEARGLPDEIVMLSDKVITIPILGSAESLNVALSCAIMLYEAARQRNFQ